MREQRGATAEYWASIFVAVALVFIAIGQTESMDREIGLFSAGYVILHAHGRRILAAIKANTTTKEKK